MNATAPLCECMYDAAPPRWATPFDVTRELAMVCTEITAADASVADLVAACPPLPPAQALLWAVAVGARVGSLFALAWVTDTSFTVRETPAPPDVSPDLWAASYVSLVDQVRWHWHRVRGDAVAMRAALRPLVVFLVRLTHTPGPLCLPHETLDAVLLRNLVVAMTIK